MLRHCFGPLRCASVRGSASASAAMNLAETGFHARPSMRQAPQSSAAAAAAAAAPTAEASLDAKNVVRSEIYRDREFWEYTPTPEHTSLVLLLYRSLLKELLKLPSVRKRTFITYVRLTFRRRGKSTEKLLIDEAIEEARRGIYVAAKHNAMKESGEYKFDDMFLPKDTGQDVANFMEEVYDPVMSKKQLENVKDVVPGKEDAHGGALRGAHYMSNRLARDSMREQLNRPVIKEADMRLRPPPPPEM
jgi:hypothetical protein